MIPSKEPEFPTREVIEDLHYDAVEQYGGHHGLLNEHLLESAINQPRNTYCFTGCDLFEVAAAYAFHIVADHQVNRSELAQFFRSALGGAE
jgi:death-on-curing protein